MDDNGSRTDLGRFARGHAGGPGRPRCAITAALRRQHDPEKIAAFLLGVIEDKEASMKDRLRAAELVQDRLEGRSVATSVSVRHTAPSLPPAWSTMSPIERGAFLDRLALAPAVGGDDGDVE
jgi:hypothetical protein